MPLTELSLALSLIGMLPARLDIDAQRLSLTITTFVGIEVDVPSQEKQDCSFNYFEHFGPPS